MGTVQKALTQAFKWFSRHEEPEFPIPPIANDAVDYVPPAVIRHLLVIRQAMQAGDTATVGNRQRRLAKLGVDVPTKLSQVDDLLRIYDAAQTDWE